jgi:pimeloyl-ACP methyl ester carboxylesterase
MKIPRPLLAGAIGLLAGATCFPSHAEPTATLARKAALGVQLETAPGGARVVTVFDGATAQRAGLRAGDVITAINGAQTGDVAGAVRLAGQLRAGDSVELAYVRDGRAGEARAKAMGRPLETYTDASATYGAVPFSGGALRDILVKPAHARPDHRVVFFVQGVTCMSVEGPNADHPYRAFAQGLAARGVAMYRIEKPGMGDSQGGPNCPQTDFATELAAFRKGLEALIETHGYAPSRIVVFGHSMGGVQGPLLAAERGDLAGIATMGTVLRNWQDYLIEVFTVQGFEASASDPVEGENLGEAMRPLLHRIFSTNEPLTTIAAINPEYALLLKDALGWDGGDIIIGRSVSFWRGLSAQRLTQAWRDAKAPVLAIYGESDFAAVDSRDHERIANVVNHYRPGSGKYVFLPRTGHGLGLEGTRVEARAANNAAGQSINLKAPYNPELTKVVADWIDTLPPARGR